MTRGAPTPVATRADARFIDRLRLSVLEEELQDPVPMSIGTLRKRHALVVEVAIDGIWGLGETWVNHPDWAWRERLPTFRHGIVPLLAGRDVSDPAAVLSSLSDALLPRAEQGAMPGAVWQALSGLDLATWDALGKIEARPVAELLSPGCAPAADVEVYASGVGPTRVEELCEVAAFQGVRAVKARVGFGAEVDRRTLGRIRAALGDEVLLFADANRAWSADEAVAMCAMLAEFGTAWVEEPLYDDRPEVLAALVEHTGMGIAGGENLYGARAFAEHLPRSRLSVVQPDPAKSGGMTTCAAVARTAASHGVAVYPHCYSGGVALAASLVLAAAFDNVSMVEVDVRPSVLRSRLLDIDRPVVAGKIAAPDGPGLGIRLDPEVRRHHLVAEEEIVIGRPG